MRTDIEITTKGSMTCPKVVGSYPTKRHVERGDFIEWVDQGTTYRGRVIGFTYDAGMAYIVTAMISLSGFISERWAEPSSVKESHDGSKGYITMFGDKAKWFFGEDFLKTDPNVARDASNKLAEEL